MRQQYKNVTRTYATWANAKKIIDKLEDGDFHWLIAASEDGRFFPVVFLESGCGLNHHYFIHKGCCVRMC